MDTVFDYRDIADELPKQPNKESMRQYILERDAFNHSRLADLACWNKTSFSLWLQGKRDIPDGSAYYLQHALVYRYGFNPF